MSAQHAPASERPYFQRGIKRFETYVGEDGCAYIRAVVLTCGHRVLYKRPRPAGSKRTAAPCAACGAGARASAEQCRDRARMNRAMRHATRSLDRNEYLEEFINVALAILSTPVTTQEQVALWRRGERAARLAGLHNRAETGAED